MNLMKQARAFGVGVMLTTQNPVDVDYKALSNAGTWMVGRLQTDRDKQRLLDGMNAAAGGVDVTAVGDTISGLAKREFVLRRAGKDQPEVFTTRWAMSYLRGPLTRDQIAQVTALPAETAGTAATVTAAEPPLPPAPASDHDTTPVMPEVAGSVPARWVDPAAPWLSEVGASSTGTTLEAAIIARVALRYDETKADLVHDEEYEAVIFPAGEHLDVTKAIAVDYDDRDLRDTALDGAVYRLPSAPIKSATYWKQVQRDLTDHLARSLTMELPVNRELKLYGRAGESPEDFALRCRTVAGERADAELSKLRAKYETRTAALRNRLEAASDAAQVARDQQDARARDDLLSSAGSILGGLLGGRRSRGGLVGQIGRAAGSAGKTSASSSRVEAAENKAARLQDDLEDLEAQLVDELTEIDNRWVERAGQVESMTIQLERSDVKVTQLVLAWVPVSTP